MRIDVAGRNEGKNKWIAWNVEYDRMWQADDIVRFTLLKSQLMAILIDTCNSVRELLSKVESYLTKNRGSLTEEDVFELENCIEVLKKMEEEHCGSPSMDYFKMGLQVVEFLLRFFLNNDTPF